jgi:hypothetical protein
MTETQYRPIAACARFADELPDYLEGEARPFIVSHARDCRACEALLGDLQAIRRLAQELPQEEPARVVWANVHARLEAEGVFVPAACARFGAALEDSLDAETRPFVVEHARECKACGAMLADLQAIQTAAHRLPLEEPSLAVWANLRAGLEAEGLFAVSACNQFAEELPAYLEGEARPFIVAHAGDCSRCGTMLSDLLAIQTAARELPQEEPSRVVWANVRARLEADGAFGVPVRGWRELFSWRWVPQAIPLGVLAVLMAVGLVLTLPSTNIQRWSGSAEQAEYRAVSQAASLLPPREDRGLAHIVSDLESSFRANESSMAPDLKATYEKSLVSLDGSIKECLASLQHEPRNTLANDYLLTAYTRKAEVLSSALEFEGR